MTKKNIQPSGTLQLQRQYATQTAVKSERATLTFYVHTPEPERIGSAKLVVGIHRTGGINAPVKATINNTPATIEIGDAAEFSDFFAPLETSFSPSI